ncbi:hypothetical protein SAMN05421786_110109 [Chryseobacterium ureilyticum]|uniref:Uncharacterized protein n=1 Tax=Chryseobacterium ureilyticum TaxID=373668 RepID=A0A1N7QIH7_9FLAO|nr:hypothetical protein SAMN05421786_110109 [Chryseobacterium ureilyticum]
MLENFIFKNWKALFHFQWISFSLFIVLTIIYYWDKTAHIYFNQNPDTINSQSIFSLLMTYLFISFIFITILYPILFLLQAYFIQKKEMASKKLILLFALYLLSIVSLFSLYTINNSHSYTKRFIIAIILN